MCRNMAVAQASLHTAASRACFSDVFIIYDLALCPLCAKGVHGCMYEGVRVVAFLISQLRDKGVTISLELQIVVGVY